ncbi:MAG: bifunctional oligoribonuclease/PAP phosphatase NrnA [Anaerolineales bacterium]|nr:MAG: bifunctional oligoribonuclease/PAP phosphatase NrnA [Anaerolineales bacterium]
MDNQLTGEIKNRLHSAKKIVIASHVRPDGDAIGSVLGLGLALQNAGKSVEMVLADGVPSSFKYLEGSELIKKEPSREHDTFITVDCADFRRVGKVFQDLGQPDINIDHHVTNEKFGKLNLIEAEEVATAAILTNHLPEWGFDITKPIAAALLTGILTDTLGFRTSNITPEALRQAAGLMETGVDLPEIYMKSLVRKTFPAAKYWGAGLTSLESKHGIVWGTLTLEDRKRTGYSGNDDADLINMISAIDGNKVGMVFVQQNNNHVKISWRALEPGVDVSPVATYFKGGGHAAAAGADIEGSLSEVQQEVLSKTRQLLNL